MGSFFCKPVQIISILLAGMTAFRWAWAEVVFDGTVGPTGTLSGDMVIPETRGTMVGNNLFHSFSTFNINTGESALFTGPSATSNIISRVTGGSASTIKGSLDHNMPNASFWLLNPNGILFGQNASLPTMGAFHATTADYLLFEEGGRFGADTSLSENSVLSVTNPSAFGFIESNPGPISVHNSELITGEGTGLSMVSGDIEINGGTMTADRGEINLASVGSAGEAFLTTNGVDIDTFSQGGEIWIQASVIGTSDESTGELGAGSISIRGGELVVENSGIYAHTYEDTSGEVNIHVKQDITLSDSRIKPISHDIGDSPHVKLSAGGDILLQDISEITTTCLLVSNSVCDSGDINITAHNMTLTSQSFITTTVHSPGNAGDININIADTLSIKDSTTRGVLSTTHQDHGNAGNIDITARAVNLDNGYLLISPNDHPFEAAGDIRIHADSLTMTNNSKIYTFSNGEGGAMSLQIRDGIFMTESHIENSAGSGDMLIDTSELTLENGSSLITTPTVSGNIGNLQVFADRVTLTNSDIIIRGDLESVQQRSRDISIVASESIELNHLPGPPGEEDVTYIVTINSSNSGGNITLTTPELSIRGRSAIFCSAEGTGQPGDINIDVSTLRLNDGGVIGSRGDEIDSVGSININAQDSVFVGGDSAISTNTSTRADAGTITIGSAQSPIGSLTLVDNSFISTSTSGLGDAGEININATGAVTLQAYIEGPHITSSAQDADPDLLGSAGAITLNANELNILGGGNISTDTQSNHGTPANIQISVNDLLIEGESIHTLQAITALENGQEPPFPVTGITSNATAHQPGGSITINVSDHARLYSGIISASSSGASGGGDIYIGNSATPTGLFSIDQNSAIFARAQLGNGGNIFIYPDAFLRDMNSRISADSNQGNAGVVEIDRVDQDVTDTILDLDNPLMGSELLISQACDAERIRQRSSLTVDGQGGLRWSPGDYMPSKMSRISTDGHACDKAALDKSGSVHNHNIQTRCDPHRPF